jgi:stage II sporulation protein R
VVANSDTDADQELKLRVRDAVIGVVTPAVEGCRSQSEAVAAIGGVMDDIDEAARRVIADEGDDYAVKVTVGEEYYPTKTYESCAFPEGTYESLRVLIGDAEGQNWWCCLFPPLCLSAAGADEQESNEDAFISVGLTGEQYKVITETDNPQYRVRFKILEVFERWFGKGN